jgi:hypothetical protein
MPRRFPLFTARSLILGISTLVLAAATWFDLNTAFRPQLKSIDWPFQDSYILAHPFESYSDAVGVVVINADVFLHAPLRGLLTIQTMGKIQKIIINGQEIKPSVWEEKFLHFRAVDLTSNLQKGNNQVQFYIYKFPGRFHFEVYNALEDP